MYTIRQISEWQLWFDSYSFILAVSIFSFFDSTFDKRHRIMRNRAPHYHHFWQFSRHLFRYMHKAFSALSRVVFNTNVFHVIFFIIVVLTFNLLRTQSGKSNEMFLYFCAVIFYLIKVCRINRVVILENLTWFVYDE